MSKEDVARMLAESLREINRKCDELQDLTGFEVHEFLTEIGDIEYILNVLLNVPPWERDKDIVFDYVSNRADYSFDEMLERVAEARRTFDPEAYEEYCERYEKEFGTRP